MNVVKMSLFFMVTAVCIFSELVSSFPLTTNSEDSGIVRLQRSPTFHHHKHGSHEDGGHGGGGGGGGSFAGSSAQAGSFNGGHGNSGSNSQSFAASSSFGFGPFSASFSQAQSIANSRGSSDSYFEDR
uniref:Glycine-rich protein n=1 Tax=Timema bartmani TaxID=61472 RepID=A0A7R9I575_9NEOP|nr:unnamed protein product [Timema bartmani]